MQKIQQFLIPLFCSVLLLGLFAFTTPAFALLCTYEDNGGIPGCEQVDTREQCQTICSRIGPNCASSNSNPTCEEYLAGQWRNVENEMNQPAPPAPARAGMGDLHANPKDQIRTKAECDLEKSRILASCLTGISADLPEEQKIPAKANCESSASAKYRECEKQIPEGSSGVIEKDGSAGYDIPKAEAASLNQFQGLTAQQVIGNIMATAMKIIGSIAFAMMVFAGFLWMTAAGNSDREKKARDIMVWSALGVIVILSSYSLVKLVLDAFKS